MRKMRNVLDEQTTLFINKDPAVFAKAEFDTFIEFIGAEVIRVAETEDGLAELFPLI